MGDVVVRTHQGRVRGVPTEHGYRFLGIPYARPPAETGRFAALQPARPWDGVRDADKYGAAAPQAEHGVTLVRDPMLPGDDYLNLNVFTPVLGQAGLPVFFWIHGGGFVAGCNASPWYDGTKFVRDGVVLVSINYRMGAQGFLLLPGAPPNRGVLDWVAALEWVHENISAFGGDASKVTIAGQSSGGGSCAALLAVPRARGLFCGDICMSGAAGLETTVQKAEEVAASMAAAADVKLTLDDFEQLPDKDLLKAQAYVLDARSRNEDKAAVLDISLKGAYLPFAPVVDGEVMTETVIQAASSAANKHIALLVGATAHEYTAHMRGEQWLTPEMLRGSLLRTGTRPDLVDQYLALHQSQPAADIAGQVKTDRGFRVPLHRLLEAWQKAGGTGFGYEFRWAPSDGAFAGLSVHALDLLFAFDLLGADGGEAIAGTDRPQALADAMHGSLVSMAKDGSPGWSQYEADQRPIMVFDLPPHVEHDPLAAELQLWA